MSSSRRRHYYKKICFHFVFSLRPTTQTDKCPTQQGQPQQCSVEWRRELGCSAWTALLPTMSVLRRRFRCFLSPCSWLIFDSGSQCDLPGWLGNWRGERGEFSFQSTRKPKDWLNLENHFRLALCPQPGWPTPPLAPCTATTPTGTGRLMLTCLWTALGALTLQLRFSSNRNK